MVTAVLPAIHIGSHALALRFRQTFVKAIERLQYMICALFMMFNRFVYQRSQAFVVYALQSQYIADSYIVWNHALAPLFHHCVNEHHQFFALMRIQVKFVTRACANPLHFFPPEPRSDSSTATADMTLIMFIHVHGLISCLVCRLTDHSEVII